MKIEGGVQFFAAVDPVPDDDYEGAITWACNNYNKHLTKINGVPFEDTCTECGLTFEQARASGYAYVNGEKA